MGSEWWGGGSQTSPLNNKRRCSPFRNARSAVFVAAVGSGMSPLSASCTQSVHLTFLEQIRRGETNGKPASNVYCIMHTVCGPRSTAYHVMSSCYY